MSCIQPTTIEAAFMLPPSTLGLSTGNADDPIIVRYDGERRGDESVIFGVISIHDVSKMAPDLVEHIFDAVSSEAGKDDCRALVASDGMNQFAYLDSDRFEEIFSEIFDEALCGGHPAKSAVGDLMLLTDENGDISLSQKSALSSVMRVCEPDDAKHALSRAHSHAKAGRAFEFILKDQDPSLDAGDDTVPSF